jgi:hypothetical protein
VWSLIEVDLVLANQPIQVSLTFGEVMRGSSYAVMGAGQKVIGTLLGHSDSASTERYTTSLRVRLRRWFRRDGRGLGAGRVDSEGCCPWWLASETSLGPLCW